MFNTLLRRRRIISNIVEQTRINSSKATESNLPILQESKENEGDQKKEYDPKDVSKEDMQWRTPWHKKAGQPFSVLRTFYKEDSKRSFLQKLHTPIDLSPSTIKKWLAKRKEYREIFLQSYIPDRNQVLGNELAAAHFIVYRGGSVKFFDEDKWIKADEHKNYTLPSFYVEGKHLQAIDCTDMNLYYEGLANITDLKNVEWLSLNGCEHMDDWCIDRIANIFSHSLIYLDLRHCPKITASGIGALYKMRKLRILYLDDFLRSTTYEMTCLLLQELNPDLDIKSDVITFNVQ